MCPAAVAATVVEELHQRHVAVQIASDPGMVVLEQLRGILGHELAVLRRFRQCFGILKDGDPFSEELRICEEIVADRLTEGVPFRCAHRVEIQGLRRGWNGQQSAQRPCGQQIANHRSVLATWRALPRG